MSIKRIWFRSFPCYDFIEIIYKNDYPNIKQDDIYDNLYNNL